MTDLDVSAGAPLAGEIMDRLGEAWWDAQDLSKLASALLVLGAVCLARYMEHRGRLPPTASETIVEV